MLRVVLTRIILLVAVLLMPLGMHQQATAAPTAHHASMPMKHCPDRAPAHEMKGGIGECTMACAGALPAMDLADHQPLKMASEPILFTAADRLHGLHPETATPPPKRS